MYFKDHAPPHFHAKYGEYEIIIEIESGIILGKFPKRALQLVLEWYEIHKNELMENWIKMRRGEKPDRIKPLE